MLYGVSRPAFLHWLHTEQRTERTWTGGGMERITVGVMAVWIILTIGIAAFLGTEFVLQEIHAFIRHRREHRAE